MKIKPAINKRVNNAVADCRQTLVDATVELLKSSGTEVTQDVIFTKTLYLYEHKGNTTETVVVDRIFINSSREDHPYYLVSLGNDNIQSSLFLSLTNLQIIYNEVRKVVREY